MDAHGTDHARRARAERRGLPVPDALSRGHRGRPHRDLDHADRPAVGLERTRPTWARSAPTRSRRSACGVSRCVAGDASGGLFERDAAGAWRRTAGETGAVVLGAACAGDALCAVADEAGDVRRSDGTGWRTESVARTALNGIACPSVELCVAVGDDGRAYHSRAGGWGSQRVSYDGALLSVACPTTRLCVAGSEDGVYTTVAPASEFQWIERELYEGAMTGVACPSVSLCVAVSDDGLDLRVGRAEHRRDVGGVATRTGR